MQETISLKLTAIVGMLMLTIVALQILFSPEFHRSFVVFCDVGQGDGAYLRILDSDILIDAGPNKKILACLSRYMPFYDRTIEYAFISHPQKDHYGGFSYILDRYTIATFVASYAGPEPDSYKSLLKKFAQKGTDVLYWRSKERLLFDKDCQISLIWPTQSFVDLPVKRDPNEYSQVLFLDCRGKRILFTGDLEGGTVKKYIKSIKTIDILKVPHHGSKNGLKKYMLQFLRPHDAIISVGKGNSYGHPHPVTLELLKKFGTRTRRTDLEGDIQYSLEK